MAPQIAGGNWTLIDASPHELPRLNWRAALELLREEAHRLLMRVYVAGNRGKAIEQYRICQSALKANPTYPGHVKYGAPAGVLDRLERL